MTTKSQPAMWGRSPATKLAVQVFVQTLVLLLVGWGIWRTLERAEGDLGSRGLAWRDLHLGWLTCSAVLYLLGMLTSGWFWQRVLRAMRQEVPLGSALVAFLVSQLGKYVPGKFLVIVLRTWWVGRHGVSKPVTVASVFVETLTMMAVGALLGAWLVAWTMRTSGPLVWLAVLAGLAVGIPLCPPVLRFALHWTRLPRLFPDFDHAIAGLTWRLFVPGWGAIVVGWTLLGGSMFAVIRAVPGLEKPPVLWTDLPLLVAGVALSTVAGFVSGLPGGLGARELVVMHLMQPRFGSAGAILAAAVHRAVMLAAELLVFIVAIAADQLRRRRRPSVARRSTT